MIFKVRKPLREGRREGRKIHGHYWKYMKSPAWRDKCEDFKKDYDGECEWCGKETKNPEVHHKNYMVLYYERRKDVNLICKKCHKHHHGKNEIFSRNKVDNLTEEENFSEILLSELKTWRMEKVREKEKESGKSFPAFCVFNDKSLKKLSIKKPKTMEELSKIEGFGGSGKRREKYGEEILMIIRKIIPEKFNAVEDNLPNKEKRKTENKVIKAKKESSAKPSKEYSPINIFTKLKRKYPEHIIFIQNGCFYEVLGEDANEINRLFGLKLSEKHGLVFTGFPCTATKFNERKEKLKSLNKHYIIVDKIVVKSN